ncbi:2TM domain-containing protein [Polaribacter cellanae]|uniref:2TM domain-containing protein n=1 Tax=Polaribacter cellanae TaxID=2818493 RepID=A0A975CQK2_9FLAO|nr:2TM domain-containing protein [Polaribacter cellanae]QTE23515.1 2TM domain-containing protein [Polaribacter cellanae]
MEDKYLQEQEYLKAKKKVKEIKDFYMHLVVMIFALPIVITVNLLFVPNFHFFWLAAFGMLFSVAIHWVQVFGFSKFGLGNNWEEKKIKQIMKENEKNR